MEALFRASRSLSKISVRSHFFKRSFQLDPHLASLASLQESLDRKPPYVRMRLHPDWKQVDNKIRRMESRLADFRLLCGDLRIQKNKLDSGDPSVNKERVLETVKLREEEVAEERAAIFADLQKLTADFVQGAQREHLSLRKFFLIYLYHTSRTALKDLKPSEFEKHLLESPDGITYELPDRGTVSFPPNLCTKVAAGHRLSVSATGMDTSPIAIAMAILQAGAQKHCDDPYCRREECQVLKSEYEELFESFFKQKVRALVFQKARGEMPSQFDNMLTLPTVEVS